MKHDVLKDLLYINRIPLCIREIESHVNAISQTMARASDEIEYLRKENRNLKKQLKMYK